MDQNSVIGVRGDAGSSDESPEHLESLRDATPNVEAILDDTRLKAFHEAGHAVMAHSFGVPVNYLSIEPFGRRLGRAEIAHTDDLSQRVQIGLAGWLAEWIANDRQPLPNGRESAADDDARIERDLTASGVSQTDATSLLDQCARAAEGGLVSRWTQLQLLATALMSELSMNANRIRTVLIQNEVVPADDLAGAVDQLEAEHGRIVVRLRHLLPDWVLAGMYIDVIEHCKASRILMDSDLARAAFSNARSALEAAAEMMYLAASAETYDERGACARAFELVALDRLARREGPLADHAIGFTPSEAPAPATPEEIMGYEGKHWSEEFSGALGAVERALKSAQRRQGGSWNGLSRSELAAVAAKAWGEEAIPLPPLWEFLYGHLSIQAHPGARTATRTHWFEDGKVLFGPRESDRTQLIQAVCLAAYLAVRSVRRAMAFSAIPDA